MSLKKNVIANYIGQGWSALISFIFIPVYIKYLGMEAYGLIGLFSLLQLTLSIVDSAIIPLINREMSRYTGNERTLESARDLLRTMEITAVIFGSAFAFIIYAIAGFIANYWLNSESLPKEIVTEAVAIAGFVVAMRFMESIYRSVLIGLQKQIGLNWILVIANSLRNIGVIFALMYIAPTIKVFFYWQGALSVFTVLCLAYYVYKQLPGMIRKAHFSIKELKENWKFALGSMGNTTLNFVCTQSDKVILSKYLSLQDFGNYSLSVTVVQAVTTLIMPLPVAFYPNIVRLKSLNDDDGAAISFHQCCQLINIVSGVAVSILFFWGDVIIGFWTKDPILASKVVPIVKILAIGAYIQQLASFPYQLPYVAGKPNVNLKAHCFSIALILAVTLPLIIQFGISGAVWGNIVQNVGFFVFFPFFFSSYLKQEQNVWLKKDVIIPFVVILFTTYLLKILIPVNSYDYIGFLQCCFIAIAVLLISSLFCNNLRSYLAKSLFNKKDSKPNEREDN